MTLYVAPGCHLCEAARDVVEEARAELGFALSVVDISGDPDLERRYRLDLPVVEIDGERAFRHFVVPAALRERLVSRARG